FKCQTEIVECSATVDLDPDRPLIVIPDDVFAPDGLSLRWPDGPHAMELRLERKTEVGGAGPVDAEQGQRAQQIEPGFPGRDDPEPCASSRTPERA
ncbi:hypothetical protein ACC735_38365, partial [Rhizobium ruizarguesonis]